MHTCYYMYACLLAHMRATTIFISVSQIGSGIQNLLSASQLIHVITQIDITVRRRTVTCHVIDAPH